MSEPTIVEQIEAFKRGERRLSELPQSTQDAILSGQVPPAPEPPPAPVDAQPDPVEPPQPAALQPGNSQRGPAAPVRRQRTTEHAEMKNVTSNS